jgi:hypothetical protein
MALATGQAGNLADSIAVTVNLFFNLLQDNPQTGATGNPKYNMDTGEPVWDVGSKDRVATHFRHRLFDPDDEFGPEVIAEVLTGLVEEWSGKAQQSAESSSPTPPRTGSPSTPPIQDSTYSAFGQTGS